MPPALVLLALSAALMAVAFLYASVGHAGASGYIAVFALAGMAPEQIKPLALLLNVVVASVGCWNYLRPGHLPMRRIWPVYVMAIPAAFLGGWLNLPAFWFRRLVGVVLFFSALRLGRSLHDPEELRQPSRGLLLAAGASLGLLAGLTGTGGGVFLTPLLLVCRWCTTREAAAVSVLFILINSIAGLAGLGWSGGLVVVEALQRPELVMLFPAVLLAGGLGSRLGSRHWPVAWIRRALAVVLLLASWKLLALPL
jgi:uncharacterized membrane protein YfcA